MTTININYQAEYELPEAFYYLDGSIRLLFVDNVYKGLLTSINGVSV